HPGGHDAIRRQRHPAGVGPLLPRSGHPAAFAQLGQHAERCPGDPLGRAPPGDLAGSADLRHRDFLQLPRRRPAGRAGSASNKAVIRTWRLRTDHREGRPRRLRFLSEDGPAPISQTIYYNKIAAMTVTGPARRAGNLTPWHRNWNDAVLTPAGQVMPGDGYW